MSLRCHEEEGAQQILVLRNSRIEHRKKPCNKNDAPAEKHGIWRNVHKLNNKDKATFFSLSEVFLAITITILEENSTKENFVVDSGASMHMLSKKDFSSDEMETPQRSRHPTTLVTANGDVRTDEETQVHFHPKFMQSFFFLEGV